MSPLLRNPRFYALVAVITLATVAAAVLINPTAAAAVVAAVVGVTLAVTLRALRLSQQQAAATRVASAKAAAAMQTDLGRLRAELDTVHDDVTQLLLRPVPERSEANDGLLVTIGAARAAAVSATLAELPVGTRVVDLLGCSPAEVDGLHADDRAALALVADSVAGLRLALPALESLGSARRLVIAIDDVAARRGAVLAAANPGLLAPTSLQHAAAAGGGSVVRVGFAAPVRVHRVAATLLTGWASGRRRIDAAGLRVAVMSWAALPWVAGDPSARTLDNATRSWRSDNPALSPYHLVLGDGPESSAESAAPSPWAVPRLDVRDRVPPVDIAVVNPHGFQRSRTAGTATVTVASEYTRFADARVEIAVGDTRLVTLTGHHQLSQRDLAGLRRLRGVDVSGLSDASPVLGARVITQLAAAAVPVLGTIGPGTQGLLHPELMTALGASTITHLDDDLAREAHAITARRAALRHHSIDAAWRALRVELGHDARPEPPVSVLLVTKRRSFLSHALAQAAAQDYPNLEIVLGLHGVDISDEELAPLLAGVRQPVVVVRRPSTTVYGDLLAEVSRHASGELIAKMDDDDLYGPHHVTDLAQALRWSQATLVGTLVEWVYLAGADRTIYRPVRSSPEAFGQWVGGGTLMLRADDLRALGG
ncbi:MAG TPA: glycosyltransferase, partial [Actinomycetes bacterium]|nr:glycosyltransferase [Actinomycetes bacterium]